MQHWTLYLYRRKWVGSLAVALGVATLALLYLRVPALPAKGMQEDFQAVCNWPEQEKIEARYFEALKPYQAASESTSEPALSYLRLAGTFMTYANAGEPENASGLRIAIIDNLKTRRQSMVQQGENFEDFKVIDVYETYAELSRGDEVFELHASLTQTASATPAETKAPAGEEIPGFEDMPALETNRFGKRIGENRWVFSRKAIMDYYEEVINDSERVVDMYKSFTTDRDPETNDPRGFRLGIQGEVDFFNEVGLREHDSILKVNSMNMLSQRRAEFMLAEFVRHNLNAVVIDVEREGKEEKLIYLIR